MKQQEHQPSMQLKKEGEVTPLLPSGSFAIKKKMGKYLKVVLFNILAVVILMGAIELLVDFLYPRNIKSIFNDPFLRVRGREFVQMHPERGFSLKPNFRNKNIRINSMGFRGPPLPAYLERNFVILCMGESTTFGWLVQEQRDYPFLLQQILKEKGYRNVYVINAGVPSYTSSQILLYLKSLIGKIKIDLVLISIMWNDLTYSTVENWYPNILLSTQPTKTQRFFLENSSLYRAFAIPKTRNKNAEDIFNETAYKYYLDNIRNMAEICGNNQINLAFIIPPFSLDNVPEFGMNPFQEIRLSKSFLVNATARYLHAMKEVSAKRGVPLIDHRLSIIGKENNMQYFFDVFHPTAVGNRMMAEDIAAFIIHSDTLAPVDFSRLEQKQQN